MITANSCCSKHIMLLFARMNHAQFFSSFLLEKLIKFWIKLKLGNQLLFIIIK